MRITVFASALMLALCVFIMESSHAQWTWTPQTGRWVNLKRLPMETPELQIEHARSLMLQGQYRQALRETDKFTQFYSDSELADENQFLRGEIRMAQGRLLEGAQEFQRVIANYPDTQFFDDSIAKQYEIGDELFEVGQARLDKRWRPLRKRPIKRAGEVYAMVVDNQPFTAAAAEAQYKIGLTHYVRKEYLTAAFEYRRVVEDYSASEWVNEASYGLAMCYYNLSLPPDYDQSPSKMTMSSIDSFRSRYPADERVDDLMVKREEMRQNIAQQRLQIARFYERRRNFDSARIYYQVVVEQFPGTEAAESAQAWLEANPSRDRTPA